MLDPEIVTAKPWQKKRKLAAMADMMSDNALLKIAAGDVTGMIPADTAAAVLNGAKPSPTPALTCAAKCLSKNTLNMSTKRLASWR